MQQLGQILDGIDTMFTAVFTLELLVNMYAHWFRPFWQDGWSIFDFFVIALSLVALGPVEMPISVIRLMRTFRVVRLFGRMRALRQIILALTASLIPVTNAFFILLIVIAICAKPSATTLSLSTLSPISPLSPNLSVLSRCRSLSLPVSLSLSTCLPAPASTSAFPRLL